MSTDEKIIKNKVGLLKLSEMLGTVLDNKVLLIPQEKGNLMLHFSARGCKNSHLDPACREVNNTGVRERSLRAVCCISPEYGSPSRKSRYEGSNHHEESQQEMVADSTGVLARGSRRLCPPTKRQTETRTL